MNSKDQLNIAYGNAICYSGYRKGQSPLNHSYPTYSEVKEDLLILARNWQYIRLYDVTLHAQTVLEVIHKEKINLKVMIGVCLEAEMNNEGCPWSESIPSEQLKANKKENLRQIKLLIKLAKKYSDTIFSVSAGNESTVDWTDHMVPVESIIEYVRDLKNNVKQAVTFCENYVPWQNKLQQLVDEVDFISLHTYPVWENVDINGAIDYTIANYTSVKQLYPHKEVVITEAGWATNSNGRGIPPHHVNEEFQKIYYERLMAWSNENRILTFIFEAFDEDWKGSNEPMEPEKHWGLFTIDRKPKKVFC